MCLKQTFSFRRLNFLFFLCPGFSSAFYSVRRNGTRKSKDKKNKKKNENSYRHRIFSLFRSIFSIFSLEMLISLYPVWYGTRGKAYFIDSRAKEKKKNSTKITDTRKSHFLYSILWHGMRSTHTHTHIYAYRFAMLTNKCE